MAWIERAQGRVHAVPLGDRRADLASDVEVLSEAHVELATRRREMDYAEIVDWLPLTEAA